MAAKPFRAGSRSAGLKAGAQTIEVVEMIPMPDPRVSAARALFPRGLRQPDNAFRFSLDALLLADFAASLPLPERATVADLGTGCGVAGLGILLRHPEWRVVGVERDPDLVDAARVNAEGLGFGPEHMTLVRGDLTRRETLLSAREALLPQRKENASPPDQDAGLVPSPPRQEENKSRDRAEHDSHPPTPNGSDEMPENAAARPFLRRRSGMSAPDSGPPLFDAVCCNPPWRREHAGRTPPSEQRRAALFGDGETLPSFCRAADALLKPRGILALVCGAERLADIFAALPARLRPTRLRMCHTRPSAPAVFFLLEARKNSGAILRVEAPLQISSGAPPFQNRPGKSPDPDTAGLFPCSALTIPRGLKTMDSSPQCG